MALRALRCFGLVSLIVLSGWAAPPPDATDSQSLLGSLQRELQRASTEFAKAQPVPYYLSYSVEDSRGAVIVATKGAIVNSFAKRYRVADVVTRVGSRALDNTHDQDRASAIVSGNLPLDGDALATARALWQLTDRGYMNASRGFLNAKTAAEVRAKEEDDSPDFSTETPRQYLAAIPLEGIDEEHWRRQLRLYSSLFREHPEIETSLVMLTFDVGNNYFVSTEGAALVVPERIVRLYAMATLRASDGMNLVRVESFQGRELAQLPSQAQFLVAVRKMAADLKALQAAPLAEPFNGPALLSGRAAAVMTHEVLGHRLEGQRQRGDDEGQTFTKKIGQRVLPDFLSLTDDPTRSVLGQTPLAGAYAFDDEGVAARPVDLVAAGVLKSFLMSRMPVKNFSQSNGHGRAQAGALPVARQGNLLMTASRSVKESALRQQLIAEVKRQGKSYGLFFDDIQGGFTLTTRQLPQAFQVLPVMVWRVYADGRPDELVRGVDIVGTPLAAFEHVLAAGDTMHVFNGVCGAESGFVPVSAAAPALLFSELETQRQKQGRERPPLLPPPPLDPPAAPGAAR